MAEFLHLFILQLLFGFFKSSLLQIISADYKSVHPGENITLHCNITNYSEIFWYRLRSEELEQLLSAERTKLDKNSYLVVYNVNESHFDVPDSSSSVSLVIIGVREADLGFYYCGGRNDATHTQFGKHIRLNFTADNFAKYSDAEEPAGPRLYCITDFIIYSVCAVSVLMNIICMCTLCCKVQWKSSCRSCSKTTDSPGEEENINYASIKYKRRPRAEDKRNTESDLDSVAYAAVASGPNRT